MLYGEIRTIEKKVSELYFCTILIFFTYDQYQSTPVFQELFVLKKLQVLVRFRFLCLNLNLYPACCIGIYFMI